MTFCKTQIHFLLNSKGTNMTLRVEIARDPTQYFVPQNTLLLLQPNIGYVCVFVNNFCSYQCTNLDDH